MVKLRISFSSLLLATVVALCCMHIGAMGRSAHARFEKLGKTLHHNSTTAKKFFRDFGSGVFKNTADDYENKNSPASPHKRTAASPRNIIRIAAAITHKVGRRFSAPAAQQKPVKAAKVPTEHVQHSTEEQKQISTHTYSSFLNKILAACYRQITALISTVHNLKNLDFSGI